MPVDELLEDTHCVLRLRRSADVEQYDHEFIPAPVKKAEEAHSSQDEVANIQSACWVGNETNLSWGTNFTGDFGSHYS